MMTWHVSGEVPSRKRDVCNYNAIESQDEMQEFSPIISATTVTQA
jgi:hypothetical protein